MAFRTSLVTLSDFIDGKRWDKLTHRSSTFDEAFDDLGARMKNVFRACKEKDEPVAISVVNGYAGMANAEVTKPEDVDQFLGKLKPLYGSDNKPHLCLLIYYTNRNLSYNADYPADKDYHCKSLILESCL